MVPREPSCVATQAVDLAVVIVHAVATGHEAIATSGGVQFPTSALGEWAEGGSEGTVGEVLAGQLGCDKQVRGGRC